MIHRLIQLLFLALLPSLVLAETVEQQQARIDRLVRTPCAVFAQVPVEALCVHWLESRPMPLVTVDRSY